MNLNQITLPSRDIKESIAFYKKMGFALVAESEEFAQFRCPEGQSYFSIEKQASGVSGSGVTVYFEIDQIDEKVEALSAQGVAFSQGVTDQPWLWREARLKDPSGNALCLYRPGQGHQLPLSSVEEENALS